MNKLFNKENILKRMTKHFPRWMDIRKRVSSSTGGAILESYAEQISKIEEAINEYKKDFFIEHYEGKEKEIIDYIHKFAVGNININELEITSIKLLKAEDKNEFYNNDKNFLYEMPYIFIKNEDINSKEIEYTLNGFKFKSKLEKIPVWNIFDEFAVFLGIKRYENETNIELKNRIIAETRNETNSSEQGLINAISNALINNENKIKKEEIIIENITPEILQKKYDETKTILEEIILLNKDVFRSKRWDVDNWEHPVQFATYLTHAWDQPIENYQDGVGYRDSLKIIQTDDINEEDIQITLMNKSTKEIDKYFKKNKITDTIPISFKQYRNEIKPLKAEYKITAKDVINITNKDISIDCYNVSLGIQNINIVDIIKNKEDIDVTMKKNYITNLNEDDKYKLVFTPKDIYEEMIIKEVTKINSLGSEKNLLVDNVFQDKFYLNDKNEIINENTKKCIKNISQCLETKNVYNKQINKDYSISIEDINEEAELTIDINGYNNELLYIQYENSYSRILEQDMSLNEFHNEKIGYFKSSNKRNGSIEINIKANQFFIEIEKGTIELIINEKNILIDKNYESEMLDKSINMNIKIRQISEDIIIKELKYKLFDFEVKTKKGTLEKYNNMYIIPNEDENLLFVKMKTHTGSAIDLNKVYIGYDTKNDKYEVEGLWGTLDKGLVIKSNCNVQLIRNDTVIINNYSPSINIEPINEECVIKLNLSEYKKITDIKHEENIVLDYEIKDGQKQYYILLKKGQNITSINIEGERIFNFDNKKLKDILNIDTSKNDKLYVSSGIGNIIKETNGIQEFVKIKQKEDLGFYDNYEWKNNNDDLLFVFSKTFNNLYEEYKLKSDINFNHTYIESNMRKEYIAYNSYLLYNKEEELDVIKNFYPYLKENSLVLYQVESMHKNISINFKGGKNWTVGLKKILLKSNIDVIKEENLIYDYSIINKDTLLSSEILIDRYQKININNKLKEIDLTTGIIELPKGYNIEYITKKKTSSFEDEPDFFVTEKITIEKDMFSKLKHSNIDEIIYIGKDMWNGSYNKISDINESEYSILNKEGIISWKSSKNINIFETLYITYTIKIPYKIMIEDDILYNNEKSSIDAYTIVSYIRQRIKIKDKLKINISDLSKKEYTDIRVSTNNPNVTFQINEDEIIFNKQKENKLAIKSGYYYIKGKEYYMYNKPIEKTVKKEINVEVLNSSFKDGYINVTKESKNRLRNPVLKLEKKDTIFKKDYREDNNINGISLLNQITACDNYNEWTSYGSNISLKKGLNDMGLFFKELIKNSYAYIKLPKNNINQYISMYAEEGLKIMIGEEVLINNRSVNEPIINITSELVRENKLVQGIVPINKNNTYLIVKGTGMLDDIILATDKTKINHVKNIDKYNIKCEEKNSNNIKRIFHINETNNKFINTEKDKNNNIKTGSLIEWNITKIKQYNSLNWKDGYIKKLYNENGNLISADNDAYFLTEPIEIRNLKNIQDIYYKINNIEFDTFKNFNVTVMTSNKEFGEYVNIKESNNNYEKIPRHNIKKYLRLKIAAEKNKVLFNVEIYSSYKTVKEENLKTKVHNSGVFISSIYDMNKSSNYILNQLNINKINKKEHVSIQVRGSRESDQNDNVWTKWYDINYSNNGTVNDAYLFKNYRFFQIRIVLSDEKAEVNIKDFKIEEIKINVS